MAKIANGKISSVNEKKVKQQQQNTVEKNTINNLKMGDI